MVRNHSNEFGCRFNHKIKTTKRNTFLCTSVSLKTSRGSLWGSVGRTISFPYLLTICSHLSPNLDQYSRLDMMSQMKDFIEQSSYLWLQVKSHDQQWRVLIGLKIQPCDIYVDKGRTLIGVSILTSWDHDLLRQIRDQCFPYMVTKWCDWSGHHWMLIGSSYSI